MDLKDHLIDEGAAKRGAWVEIEGARFLLVFGESSPEYTRALARLQDQVDAGEMGRNSPTATKELCRIMARTAVLGWAGVKIGEEEVGYTKDRATEILIRAPKLRKRVIEELANPANFPASDQDLKDLAKNWGGSSDGEAGS